jgi:hypothetical protein
MFSALSVPRCYKQGQLAVAVGGVHCPYLGGVEYLHRDPASHRRRQKGSLKSEKVKYGHESQGTRPRERLR